jgi:hypothetical protein
MPKTIAVLLLLLSILAQADDSVPAWLIRLPESVSTVFAADTSAAVFHRFDRNAQGVVQVAEDYISIGKGGTGKMRTGDQRTPLGIYFVTEQLDTTRLHEKYGVMAFPLDYPNAWDRRLGRTGYGIWVHGVDRRNGRRPRLDTDGCIALPNERLLALEDSFEPNVTPVIIGTELSWTDAATLAATRASLEQVVSGWAAALEDGDMFAWLALYDDDFVHWGMNKDDWSSFSLETLGQRGITAVRISDLLLLADPVEEGLFLARFRMEVVEKEGTAVTTMRRLYWRRSESGALRIIAEDSG